MFDSLELFQGDSVEPKFKQIADALIHALRDNKFVNGDKLPTVREMCAYYSISRDTVCKAYEELREKGIIEKAQGKGYIVCNDNYKLDLNVFIMFDIWNAYKEEIYRGIYDTINAECENAFALQVYYSNRDEDHFEEFLTGSIGKYEYYVVMPFPSAKVKRIIQEFDQSKLLVADVCTDYAGEGAAVVAQCHDKELTRVLNEARELIRKYDEFVLCVPEGFYIPQNLKDGYTRFCMENKITPKFIDTLTAGDIKKGSAYFIIEDRDLVTMVQSARDNKYKLGKDVGLLSYNNTPLKQLIEGGITMVSIDFYQMGVLIAKNILSRDRGYQLVPTELIAGKTL